MQWEDDDVYLAAIVVLLIVNAVVWHYTDI